MDQSPQQALIADMKRVLYIAVGLIIGAQLLSGWPLHGKPVHRGPFSGKTNREPG